MTMSAPRAETIIGRRALWFAAWLAMTIAMLWLARDLPWSRAGALLASPRPSLIAVALFANLLILPLWALEWWRLAPVRERPTLRRTFEVVALTSSTLNTIPFFAGEAAAVVLLVVRAGLSRAGALSVLALDQLLVGVAKLAVLGLAMLLAPIPAPIRSGIGALAMTVTLAGLAMWLLARGATDSGSPSPSAGFPLGALRTWAERLEVLRDPSGAAFVLALALGKKALEILAIVVAQQALGVALPWWSGVLIVAALGIGTLVPLAPANLGTYEATVFLTYRYLGLPAESALGLALLHHLAFLLPAIGVGWLVLLARQVGLGRNGERAVAATIARP